MLKKILSIAGRPGLFKIIGQGRNNIFVEDIISGKRFPASMRDKIMSLGDITMYADSGDLPLSEILTRIYVKAEGKKLDLTEIEASKSYNEKFSEIVPDFDRDRVYNSDIKKLFNWYNLLLDGGITEFKATEEENQETKEENQ